MSISQAQISDMKIRDVIGTADSRAAREARDSAARREAGGSAARREAVVGVEVAAEATRG